jgi:cytochrome c2
VVIAALTLAACGAGEPLVDGIADADTGRGLALIQRYGCGGCHVIPGIADARGQVGPPLERIARRAYLGGVLPNTADNMRRWLRSPQTFEPGTAMPDLGLSEPEARDITAYLYSR